MTSNDFIQLALSALFNVVFCGLWALVVERRVKLRDEAIQAIREESQANKDKLRELEDKRLGSIEARLTGLHKSKDALGDKLEEKLTAKVDERTLHRELEAISDKIEQGEKRQSRFESEMREDLRGLHEQSTESATVLNLIAARMNITLPGNKPRD